MAQLNMEAMAGQIRPYAAGHHDNFTPPVEALEAFKRAGLFGLSIAPGLPNSLGANHQEIVEAVETLATGDQSATTGFIMHLVAGGFTHHPGVSDEAKLLLANTAGEYLISSPISEVKSNADNAKSFISDIEAFDLDEDTYEVREAVKMFASNFGISDKTLPSFARQGKTILALLDKGPGMTEGPITSEGLGFKEEPIWAVNGLRSTLSNRVVMRNVLIPKDRVIIEADNFLDMFMGESGMWTYGYLTAGQLGGAKQVLQLLIDSGKPGYDNLIDESTIRLAEARDGLLRAAEATDAYEKDPKRRHIGESAVMLLQARLEVSTHARDIWNKVDEAMGLHARLGADSGISDGEADRIMSDLQFALYMPPKRKLVEDALSNIGKELPPF